MKIVINDDVVFASWELRDKAGNIIALSGRQYTRRRDAKRGALRFTNYLRKKPEIVYKSFV